MAEAEEELPQLHLGEVCQVDIEKGFSHIRCPDSGYEGDVFVYRLTVDPSLWAVGDKVACSIEIGPRGKPQAISPVWRLQGTFNPGEELELGEFVGIIGELHKEGHSFVESEDVVEAYGKHAHLTRKIVQQCHLLPGDKIGFHVDVSAQGSPTVSCPVWLDCSSRKPEPKGGKGSGKSDNKGQGKADLRPVAFSEVDFSHESFESPYSRTPLWKPFKVVLCRHFEEKGECQRGDRCTFAHGEEELRKPPSEQDLADFIEKNGIDQDAAKKLYELSSHLQAEILLTAKFENAHNPSAVLTRMIRDLMMTSAPPGGGQLSKTDLDHFLQVNGIDDNAAEFFLTAPVEVQLGVLATSNFEGAKNPSAVLTSAVKRVSEGLVGHGADLSQWLSWEQPPTKVPRMSSSTSSGGFFFGQVSMADRAKGFSLVDCLDSGYISQVMVKSLVAPPIKTINIGDIVACRVKEEDGKPQAVAPLFRLVGAEFGEMPPDIGIYVGRLARIKEDGCGFVESDAITKDYSYLRLGSMRSIDAFVAAAVMQKCEIDLGDTIAFTVSENKDGKPQVQAPCWKCCSVDGIEGIQGTKISLSNYKDRSAGAGNGQFNRDNRDNYYVGKIKKVDINNCWISCPTSGFDHDVSVHKTTADPILFKEGDFVAFPLHVNSRGQPQASCPMWKLAGYVTDESKAVFGEFFGRIKEPTPAGQTFVECPDLHAEYNRDVFLHQSVIDECGLVVGETFAFCLHLNPRGQPQVSAPCWRLCSAESWTPALGAVGGSSSEGTFATVVPDAAPGKGKRKNSDEAAKGVSKGVSTSPPWEQDTVEAIEGSHAVGWVTQVVDERTHYVVEVPGAGFEQGVTINFSVATGLKVDDTVFFMLHENFKGRPQASKLAPVWKLVGRKPAGKVAEIGKYIGKVTDFNNGGWAPVICQDVKNLYGENAMIDKFVLEETGLRPGDFIYFDAHPGKQGTPKVTSPCWKNASPYEPQLQVGSAPSQPSRGVKRTAPTPEPDTAKSARVEGGVHAVGWVKSVDAVKGFSMVEVPNSGYDRDVLVYGKIADPEFFNVGDTVFFQIRVNRINNRNIPQAAPPVWKLVGDTPEKDGDVSMVGTFKGKVREVNEDGSAHVLCPDVVAQFGGEAWLDSEVLNDTGIRPDDIIFFDIIDGGARGILQVCAPLWKSCSAEKWTPISGNLADRTHEAPRTPPVDQIMDAPRSNSFDQGYDQRSFNYTSSLGVARSETKASYAQPTRLSLSTPSRRSMDTSFAPRQALAPSQDITFTPRQAVIPTQEYLPESHASASPPRDPRQSRAALRVPPPLQPMPALQFSAPAPSPEPPVMNTAPSVAAVADTSPFMEGDKAEIYGLNSEAGQALNGLRVTVVKNIGTGRVQVRFAPEARRPQDVRLKAINLRRV